MPVTTRSLATGITATLTISLLTLTGPPGRASTEPEADGPATTAGAPEVPPVLAGQTWLTHHRDDLMPYWDLPVAYGDPVGNFPTFRDRSGNLIPDQTDRGTSTLGRGVYGYTLAFMLTGEERYLTYARAGLDWIEAHAEDHVHGGYFGDLTAAGDPVDPFANKDLFDLASVGLGYAMYFNATRDPAAEAKLLAIRDLVFGRYYDAASNRLRDSLTYDLSTEVDTGGNGGDITNYLVPATAMLLPDWALLSDQARRAQFLSDLRNVTQALIDRHKNDRAANPANRWMFWGRTARFGSFNALATDLGHTILSYAVVHDADQLFPDRPWDRLAADRTAMLARAWDAAAGRWNQKVRNFAAGNVEPDSNWWTHDEADQLLATLDLTDGFSHTAQLATSAQTFLDVYVDRDPAYPVRETFSRVSRNPEDTNLGKSGVGKNMLHNDEHALILYLHGQALEGRPARLYYAFPHGQALTDAARPYWFDATGQSRTVVRPLAAVPGHDLVAVDFTGIGQVPRPPYPAPDDQVPPTTTAVITPSANDAGWNRGDVHVAFSSRDEGTGVAHVDVRVEEAEGRVPATASVQPGDHATLDLAAEGEYDVTFGAVDALGNAEPEQHLRVRIDRTPPTITGLPPEDCRIWPPNHRFVQVADVRADDQLSGVADVVASATADAPGRTDDVVVDGGRVWVRAVESPPPRPRVYTVEATAADVAGNTAAARATCTVTRTPQAGR